MTNPPEPIGIKWWVGACLLIIWPIIGFGQQASRITGVWVTAKGEGRVRISKCEEGAYCGKLIWTENQAQGKALKKDVNNPDPAKQDRTVLGIRLLKGLTYNEDEEQWEGGEIYDPNKGQTYNCYAELVGPDKLKLRGYIGFSLIGRSTIWKRYKGN